MTAALLLSVLLSGLLPDPGPAQTFSAPPDPWLSYDAGTNTVTFELIAGPFTFNGYRDGGATLLVPSEAKIVLNFVNKDGTPHSAIVISEDGPIPNAPSDGPVPTIATVLGCVPVTTKPAIITSLPVNTPPRLEMLTSGIEGWSIS